MERCRGHTRRAATAQPPTITREFPPFLCDLLRSPPRAGAGGHGWLFRVARQLHAHLAAFFLAALAPASIAFRIPLIQPGSSLTWGHFASRASCESL